MLTITEILKSQRMMVGIPEKRNQSSITKKYLRKHDTGSVGQ